MGKTNELGPEEPQSREQAKLPLSRRLRYWWWGGFEGPNWEEPTLRIIVHPPGPGAKLTELVGFFHERWKEFLFLVAVTLVGGLVLALAGLG